MDKLLFLLLARHSLWMEDHLRAMQLRQIQIGRFEIRLVEFGLKLNRIINQSKEQDQ